MWRVNPQSGARVCCEPPSGVIFDEGVLAFDLYPPGMMYKLDCPWVSSYLFVSLGKWFVTNREQPVLTDIRRHCWEPGGTHRLATDPASVTAATRISLWIWLQQRRTWSRPSCTQRHRGTGRRHLAVIWQN